MEAMYTDLAGRVDALEAKPPADSIAVPNTVIINNAGDVLTPDHFVFEVFEVELFPANAFFNGRFLTVPGGPEPGIWDVSSKFTSAVAGGAAVVQQPHNRDFPQFVSFDVKPQNEGEEHRLEIIYHYLHATVFSASQVAVYQDEEAKAKNEPFISEGPSTFMGFEEPTAEEVAEKPGSGWQVSLLLIAYGH